jgi:16S rRNA G966 N2-methylase RsmD
MDAEKLAKMTSKEVQDFVRASEGQDETKLSLKHKILFDLPFSLIAQQLVGRRRAKEKIPTLYNAKGIVYPPTINMEQCSSEATAKFKASAIEGILSKRDSIVDLTGGFGIDTLFFSKQFKQATYIEGDRDLFLTTKHNHQQLDVKNILHLNESAEVFLESNKEPIDLFFIDPSRRTKVGKTYKLTEYSPDITKMQDTLLKQSPFFLIKASPLLDIQHAIRELKHVKKIWVVSLDNECKELLFLIQRDFLSEPIVEAVNLKSHSPDQEVFSFSFSTERAEMLKEGALENYLYEPNASILKAGAFKLVATQFELEKIQVNTHLYTSHKLVQNFPGRIFQVESKNPNESILKKLLPEGKANVVTRNYPLSPEELKKKLKLKDGGEKFVIGFSNRKTKTIVICTRIK